VESTAENYCQKYQPLADFKLRVHALDLLMAVAQTRTAHAGAFHRQDPSSTNWPLAAIADKECPQFIIFWFKSSFARTSGAM
jgi:hypothetical protein